jgi:hypothetical protein
MTFTFQLLTKLPQKTLSRWLRLGFLAAAAAFITMSATAQMGASVPWTTYEAENMTINGGTLFPPGYLPDAVQSESSGRQCVELTGTGQYIEFTAAAAANALVVRYSVPDTASGGGTNYTLSLLDNGVLIAELPVTSMYSWLYGAYPFTNNPSAGFAAEFLR